MFTGLIEKTGTVIELLSPVAGQTSMTRLKIGVSHFPCELGESIAVNGCCLTITEPLNADQLCFDVSDETLSCTTLTNFSKGTTVNLERALALGGRLGGHLVSGHVDGLGEVVGLSKDEQGWQLTVSIPKSQAGLVIPKGSMCLDGISLTVNEITDEKERTLVRLTLIPTTLELTSFSMLSLGQKLNVEYDLVGKYLLRQKTLL